MALWEHAWWEPADPTLVPRLDRRSGAYARYVPDTIDGIGLAIDGAIARRVNTVERGIRSLNGPGIDGLAGIARFLLRSEAIASSRIEGIAPSAQQVALAELGQSENVRGISDQARLVANNMTVVRQATTKLAESDDVTVDDIVSIHRSLLPDEPRHHGLRDVQNWIGSSSWTPIGAAYVPPDPERVSALMADLVGYLNGASHAPLIQAAVIHAQFETIHPFTDGNGRVGRALIHTVLTRRGLTSQAVLPISLVLATMSEGYIDGLTNYRHTAPAGSAEASEAVNRWLDTFVAAATTAIEQASTLMGQITELRDEWAGRLTSFRESAGVRGVPRADSAVARLLGQLTEAPVITATTLAGILGVSQPAANGALDELRRAGILTTKAIDRGATAYVARDVLDLITHTERALASTQFDTRIRPPERSAPARPQP